MEDNFLITSQRKTKKRRKRNAKKKPCLRDLINKHLTKQR